MSRRLRRSILRRHARTLRNRARPPRTCQINPQNRSTDGRRPFRFDEYGCLPAQDPDVDVWGAFPTSGATAPATPYNFHLYNIVHGSAFGVADANCRACDARSPQKLGEVWEHNKIGPVTVRAGHPLVRGCSALPFKKQLTLSRCRRARMGRLLSLLQLLLLSCMFLL